LQTLHFPLEGGTQGGSKWDSEILYKSKIIKLQKALKDPGLKYNIKEMKLRRKNLRINMTHAEVVLWNQIRRRQIHDARFRRQFSINNFIVDFYSPEIKMVIEVDGMTHHSDDEREYDVYRQSKMEDFGITFLRFTNDEIYGNLSWVVEEISKEVLRLKS